VRQGEDNGDRHILDKKR